MTTMIIKIIIKGTCYYLMVNVLKHGCKGIQEAGEAQDENKSVLVPLGKHGFKMGLYSIGGLVLKDIGQIIGVIPSPVIKAVVEVAPKVNAIKSLFPWL